MKSDSTARPAIPRELQRKVLVESAYCCAICRYPATELHHIIPWSKCKKHEFENLIALCPNCHVRADRGEIDRKALREYKRRLSLGIGIETLPAGELTCETITIEESLTDYDVRLSIPQIKPITLNTFVVNSNITSHFVKELMEMRAGEGDCEDSLGLKYKMQLSYDHELNFINNDLLSIKVVRLHDASMAGAAHPNHDATTLNFNLSPAYLLTLSNIFDPESKFLEFLSEFSRQELYSRFFLEGDPDLKICGGEDTVGAHNSVYKRFIDEGTIPVEVNFQHFRLTKTSLIFTFNEYQVADYVSGEQEVEVPYGAMKLFIAAHSALRLAFMDSSLCVE